MPLLQHRLEVCREKCRELSEFNMGDSQLEVFDWKPAYAMLIRLEVLATWKPQSSLPAAPAYSIGSHDAAGNASVTLQNPELQLQLHANRPLLNWHQIDTLKEIYYASIRLPM